MEHTFAKGVIMFCKSITFFNTKIFFVVFFCKKIIKFNKYAAVKALNLIKKSHLVGWLYLFPLLIVVQGEGRTKSFWILPNRSPQSR